MLLGTISITNASDNNQVFNFSIFSGLSAQLCVHRHVACISWRFTGHWKDAIRCQMNTPTRSSA